MANRGLLPDVPRLLQLKQKGHTDAEIGKMFGVSRQAVSLKLRGATEPKYRRREWPWNVDTRHKIGWMYEGVSYYVASQTKGQALTQRQSQHLASFMDMMDRMDGYVVDYYPETSQGFRLRKRRPTDDPASLLAKP